MNASDKPLWSDLEKKFHEPARLALVTALCESPAGLGFQELKEFCGMTDGNLSRHLKVLEEGGIVQQHKTGRGRRARTQVVLTRGGRDAFLEYLQALERVLHGALEALEPSASHSPYAFHTLAAAS